jgi:hypothetical protein
VSAPWIGPQWWPRPGAPGSHRLTGTRSVTPQWVAAAPFESPQPLMISAGARWDPTGACGRKQLQPRSTLACKHAALGSSPPLELTSNRVLELRATGCRDALVARHEASPGELIGHVAQAIDRFRADELDAFAADRALFQYSRCAKELWKFCTLTPVEIAAAPSSISPRSTGESEGAPRRPQFTPNPRSVSPACVTPAKAGAPEASHFTASRRKSVPLGCRPATDAGRSLAGFSDRLGGCTDALFVITATPLASLRGATRGGRCSHRRPPHRLLCW